MVKIMHSKGSALSRVITKRLCHFWQRKILCNFCNVITFFGHFCFTITAEYSCNTRVVEALYCLWPAAEITQNMPLAHSIANPIWFLISYYSNLAQIYCITTTTENPQPPPPQDGWNQFYPRSFCYNKTAEKNQVWILLAKSPEDLPDLISKCLFVFLPLDMCSGNINVPLQIIWEHEAWL